MLVVAPWLHAGRLQPPCLCPLQGLGLGYTPCAWDLSLNYLHYAHLQQSARLWKVIGYTWLRHHTRLHKPMWLQHSTVTRSMVTFKGLPQLHSLVYILKNLPCVCSIQ